MKKEVAADEEGEADVLVMGTGSPAWLGPLSLQGVKEVVVVVVLQLLVVVFVMVATGASKAVTSLSASPIRVWAC